MKTNRRATTKRGDVSAPLTSLFSTKRRLFAVRTALFGALTAAALGNGAAWGWGNGANEYADWDSSTEEYLAYDGEVLGPEAPNLVATESAPSPESVAVSTGTATGTATVAAAPTSFSAGATSGAAEMEAQLADARSLQAQIDELKKETAKLKTDFDAAEAKAKKSSDPTGPWTAKLGGSAIADAVFISQDEENKAFFGDAQNGFKFSDVRINVAGKGFGNIEYFCILDIAESLKIQDCYIRYKDSQYFGTITAGHFFVETGCESVVPVFDKTFAALDESTQLCRLGRRLGVATTRYGVDKEWRLFTGAFMAKSLVSSPYRVNDDDPGLILNARLTGTPIYVEDADKNMTEVLHVGGSFYWLGATGDDATLSIKSRGLNWSGTNPYFLNGTISLADRSYSVSQAEAIWQRGGFALTSDGFCASIENDGGNIYGATVGARMFLTPGAYHKYSKDAARFTGCSMPKNAQFMNVEERVIGENLGAWELLGKWGWSETPALSKIDGATSGTVDRMVFGVNWFWNENTRWTFDWERAFVDVAKGGKATDSTSDTFDLMVGVKF